MTIVFAFLVLLVLTMNLLFQFLKRFFPKSLEPVVRKVPQRPSAAEARPQDELARIAAVVAATRAHILTHYRG